MNENDRLHIIQQAALELFEGDNEAAQEWIRHPVKGLGGRRPVDLVYTDDDTKTVLDLIGRLEYGVFS